MENLQNDSNEPINWNILGDNKEKITFTIPVGEMDAEKAEEEIAKLISDYKENTTLIDDSTLLINDVRSTIVKTYTIPVGGNTKKKWWQFWKRSDKQEEKAKQALAELMAQYKDDIRIDSDGELWIDSNKQIPISKDYWFPSPSNEENGETK